MPVRRKSNLIYQMLRSMGIKASNKGTGSYTLDFPFNYSLSLTEETVAFSFPVPFFPFKDEWRKLFSDSQSAN